MTGPRVYTGRMRAVLAVLATTLAGVPLHAAEPAQSTTVIGPSNPQLAAGAEALQDGRAERSEEHTSELQSPI